VLSSNLSVVTRATYAAFASLQSRVHEEWSRVFMSTMKDDLAYTPTTCFEPFPFLQDWDSGKSLERVGKDYYEYRARIMAMKQLGLTNIYNRFHDPTERDPEIFRLRAIHDEMDRTVLDAYGWTDIPTRCEFLLDYEEDEDDQTSRRKKPWRYRWPDDVRDEVLARLLELNAKRAGQEALSGLTAAPKSRAKSKEPKSPSLDLDG
jgi:hypothetical protein